MTLGQFKMKLFLRSSGCRLVDDQNRSDATIAVAPGCTRVVTTYNLLTTENGGLVKAELA